jgi:hypothetical protein
MGVCSSQHAVEPSSPRVATATPTKSASVAPAVIAKVEPPPVAKPAGGTELDKLMAAGGIAIPEVHHRGITVKELRLVAAHVKERCASEGWIGQRPNKDGVMSSGPLTPEQVNLYHLNEFLLKPATKKVRGGACSLVERLATKPRTTKIFLSHAWGHPLLSTLCIIEQHMLDREYTEDDAVWICAFALRQNDPGAEIPDTIPASPFFLAIQEAQITLIVMGEKAELLDRMCAAPH